MPGLLSRFIKSSALRANREHLTEKPIKLPPSLASLEPSRRQDMERLVILGVLLNRVAYADEKISEEEERCIERILCARGASRDEAALVTAASREAADKRPDIQGFTREVNKKPYEERIRVVELLFEVALADSDLAPIELAAVRQVAGLLWVSHKDFIEAKLRVKKTLKLQ